MEKPILGYWDVRGIAEPIRYLLRYKNIDFEDKQYPLDDRDSWYGIKYTLGLDFPNLPYFFDGTVKLSQTVTILRYLAEKYGLDGQTAQEKQRISLLEQQIVDLRVSMTKLVYNEQFVKLQPEFLKTIPVHLKLYETFLGDREYFAGDRLTYVDFMAFEIIDFCRLFVSKVLDGFPKIKAYQEKFQNLPGLKEYLQSAAYKSWPIFAAHAHFGGKGPEPKDG